MKKLLITLFSALVLAGCANDPYKIDPVATAKAQWEVGELIFKEEPHFENSRYRKFLGITDAGQVLIQEFYTRSGKKATNPFLVSSIEAAKLDGGSFEREIDGVMILWYENGQKALEGNFQKGKVQGVFREWHDNGQKSLEGHVKNNTEVGVWRERDKKGNLTKEIDHGYPEDKPEN